jgi:cobalt-precorrin 5A hydrolase
MTSTAVVAISRRGSDMARKVTSSLGAEVTLYLERRFQKEWDGSAVYQLPVRPLLQRLFSEHRELVLFMPVGAAMRLLAPCLKDKHTDPAVVCVDDAGRFAVSLLSGHLGGADRLAQEVALALGATPVITSASQVTGTLAVDLLGHEFGWQIDSKPEAVTRASAAVVNGDPVGILQEAGEGEWWPTDRQLPANVTLYPSPGAIVAAKWAAALIITDKQVPMAGGDGDGETFQEGKLVIFSGPGLWLREWDAGGAPPSKNWRSYS